jgi:hypothetical protein
LILAAILVACGFAPVDCSGEEVVLLLNQTPVKGGEISPIAGVHHFEPGSQITLTANAKPGYQFVHWLGDVSDATATKTMVYLNKPKVVVAVFEQAEYGARDVLPGAGGGGGGGGLMPTASNFYPQGGISAGGGGGGAKPSGPTINVNKTTPEVPEPATGVLMVMGSLFAFSRRRARRRASHSAEVES